MRTNNANTEIDQLREEVRHLRGLLAAKTETAATLSISESQAAEQTRDILESITDAYFALDREWRFTYVNEQTERLLDRPRSDMLGKVLWTEYPGLLGSEFERVYLSAAHAGNPGRHEIDEASVRSSVTSTTLPPVWNSPNESMTYRRKRE